MARTPLRTLAASCVLTGLLLTPVALGQLGSADSPPAEGEEPAISIIRPAEADTPAPSPRWLYYLIMCALGVGAVGVTIMPSQRTHQD